MAKKGSAADRLTGRKEDLIIHRPTESARERRLRELREAKKARGRKA